MRHVDVLVKEDEDCGEYGFKFAKPHKMCNGKFVAINGLILAHDLLEHQQGVFKIGSIGDELIALGGVMYTRGQWGVLSKDFSGAFSPEESVANDVFDLAYLYFEYNMPIKQTLIKPKNRDGLWIIESVIDHSRRRINESSMQNISPETVELFLSDATNLMLHGWNLAERRFGCGLLAHDMFWMIEDETKHVISDLCSAYEGMQFRISYGRDFVHINEIYDERYF